MVGCSRQSIDPLHRLSLLPANILVASPSSEWMRLAVPLVIEQDVASAPDLAVTVASGESALYQAAASSALRTTVDAAPGRFVIHAALSDISTQRVSRDVAVEGTSSSFIALLDTLARQLDSHAVPFSTHSQTALEAFTNGFFATDPQRKIERLRAAVAADSSFGLAHLALIDALAGTHNPDLSAALNDAAAHRASFTSLDRARLAVLEGRLQRSPLPGRVAAGLALAKFTPNDADALASVAADLFLSGDSQQALRLANRALAISPGNAVFRQQLALGLVESHRFTEAAKIFESLAPGSPAALPQIAFCNLLAGNDTNANFVFGKFVESLANPDAKLLLRASWQALAGNRKEAVRQLSTTQFADPRVSALARGQIVLWQLLEKQPDAARQTAAAGVDALASALAAGAPSAAAWHSRVESLPPSIASPERKLTLLRYGYFLLAFYPESVAAWQQADRESGGADLRARAMLAASLQAAGHADQARLIHLQPFLPDFSDFYDVVSFAQLRRLLGQAG